MTPNRARLVLFALLALATLGAQAGPRLYRFDTVHSQIQFSVSHDGFSNAIGLMHIAAGWLRLDPDDWSTAAAELDIDLASVDMGDADWNRAVRGRGLLDSDGLRYAHFVSTAVKRTSTNEGVLEGNLTLRGITRPVRIDFRLNRLARTIFAFGKTLAGFTGTGQLQRDDFGITRNPGSIGHQVYLRLEIEAVRDADAQRTYQQWVSQHAAAQ